MDQEKKIRILLVAKEKFDQFGFKKTTVDEIAQGAGISKRTLYEMFESKEKILSELVTTEALSVRRNILGQLKKLSDPLEKLKTLTQMAMDYFRRNPFLGKVLSDDTGLYAPFLTDEIRTIEQGIENMFLEVLREGTSQGVFRKVDEKATASCIFILFRSFTYASTLKPSKAWVQFILNAILKDNGGSQ